MRQALPGFRQDSFPFERSQPTPAGDLDAGNTQSSSCLTGEPVAYPLGLVNTRARLQRLKRRDEDYGRTRTVPALCKYRGETLAPELQRAGMESHRDLPLSLRVMQTSLQDACFWRRKS